MKSSKIKKLLGLVTAMLTALCLVTASLPSAKAASVYDEYLSWSQLDSRWGNVAMGGSTIRSSGCLITSLAIMLVHSGSIDSAAMKNLGISDIEQFNPGVLANAYTSVNGFSSGGAISSWGTIHQLVPKVEWGWDKYFSNTSKEAVSAEIKSLMSQGWHIIARVAAPYGGYHWVYIQGVTDETIYICDPAKDERDLYEAYADGLQGEYWALKGANAPDMSFKGPVVYEPELTLSVYPKETVFDYGEAFDASGFNVTLSGVHPDKGPWENSSVPLSVADLVYYDASDYDPFTAGTYEIRITAMTEYATAETFVYVTVSQPVGEYFLEASDRLEVYGDHEEGTAVLTLTKGNVVNVTECYGDYGLIESDDFTGWVNVSLLADAASGCEYPVGDINNDGSVDKYDLSLLNDYIRAKSLLPDGISTLTSVERAAADINSDGVIDDSDVIGLLKAIYSL